MLCGDDDLVSDEEGRVEPDTELSNQNTELVGADGILKSVKEVSSARLGDGTEVGDKVLLGHTNTSVGDE